MEHREQYDAYVAAIDLALEQYLPDIPIPQVKLLDAMHYSLFAGGKRIRPVLLLAFCQAAGGNVEHAMPFACALEMIHTYSLIHDDLPCMDDDQMRRGRPTNHMIFGESTAMLAGDALLSAAFETMLDEDYTKPVPPELALRAAHAIAWASGLYGMAGGQLLDMEPGEGEWTRDTVTQTYIMKTGALFSAAAEAGCILAGITGERQSTAAHCAQCLGLAFQIQDDILNVESSEQVLGKGVGTDDEAGKHTFVKILGVEKCRETVELLTAQAKQALNAFDNNAFLLWLADLLARREK